MALGAWSVATTPTPFGLFIRTTPRSCRPDGCASAPPPARWPRGPARGEPRWGEREPPPPAFLPHVAAHGLGCLRRARGGPGVDFGIRVVEEVIDRHETRHPELLEVADVALEVHGPALDRLDVRFAEVFLLHPAVHLQRPHRDHDD